MYLKIIIFILLIPTYIFAKDINPLVESIEILLKKDDYKNACKLVDEFYEQNPYSFKANLYYGKCVYYAGDIDAAMAAYDRAEILNEDSTLVHKHLGDLHAHIGNIEIANSEYDKADRFGKDVVERAIIGGQHNSNSLSILTHISVGVDSNVKYNAELSDMNDWFGVIGYTNEPESDTFVKEYVKLTHVYDSNPFSSFYYKNQLHVYNKNYAKYSTEDFTHGELYSGPGWASKSFDLWLPVSYTYMATDYEGYAEAYAFKPQMRKRFENQILLRAEAGYEYQKYLQWNEGDKDIYSGNLSLSRWFGKHYFRVAYRYLQAKKQKSDSPRVFIDRNLNEAELKYTFTITDSIELGAGYLYNKTLYKDLITTASSQKREDILGKYSGYISYNIAKHIVIMLQYVNYNNRSNYTPSDYEKEVISAGLYLYY